MAQREDFEIYSFLRNGHTWYGFKVDYYGVYSAPSEEQIKKIRTKIRQEVKARLDWVEKENKRYYARLAEEEEKRASLLREAKQIENNVIKMLSLPSKSLTNQEKRLRADIIYRMVSEGMTNEEIQAATNAPMQSIARVRYEYDKQK